MCKHLDFDVLDGGGTWLDKMAEYLSSSDGSRYFKLYTVLSEWDMNWRVYSGAYTYDTIHKKS